MVLLDFFKVFDFFCKCFRVVDCVEWLISSDVRLVFIFSFFIF